MSACSSIQMSALWWCLTEPIKQNSRETYHERRKLRSVYFERDQPGQDYLGRYWTSYDNASRSWAPRYQRQTMSATAGSLPRRRSAQSGQPTMWNAWQPTITARACRSGSGADQDAERLPRRDPFLLNMALLNKSESWLSEDYFATENLATYNQMVVYDTLTYWF